MKTRIITIANNKGGVAKTTTAFNLSKGLAKEKRKVLSIDLDPQGNLTTLTGLDKNENKTISEIFLNKDTDIKDLILKVDDIDILTANNKLQLASEVLQNQTNAEYRLQIKLKDIKQYYDYIIIDTPPSTNILTKNGIIASTEIIAPIQAEYIAEQGLADFLQFINEINNNLQEINQQPKYFNGALITMKDNRININKQIEEDTKTQLEKLGLKTFKTTISRNVKITEAPIYNKSIFDYNNTSQGATDYKNFVLEIIEQESKGAENE